MRFVVEQHEELEIDLHHMGVDLLDLWRGTLSFRRLSVLMQNLPAGSATIQVSDPDSAFVASWGTTDYLLALVADILGKANFQKWKPIPRPAEVVEERTRTDNRRRALIERYEERQRAAQAERAARPRAKRR